MNRHHGAGYNEIIGVAFGQLPERLVRRFSGVGFVTGIAPVKIGLPDFNGVHLEAGYDWFTDYAECASTWHGKRHGLPDDQVTIFLPYPDPHPTTVLHELGHALHAQVDWLNLGEVVTDYGKSNPAEAFADIFMEWAWNGTYFAREMAAAPKTVALLEQLS